MSMRRGVGELAGRHVLVTGGARGIGAAVARTLVRAGADVTIADVDLERAEGTAADLGAKAVELDVADRDSWERVAAELDRPVDVLVNNAGIMPLGDFFDEPDAVTRRQIDINLLGVMNGCKTMVPGMVERGRGHVVNIASQAGKMAVSGGTTYSATKFAVVGFSYGLDDELRDTPVAVTCVLPGIVDTELSLGLPATPFAPRVSPEAIADAILAALRRPRRQVWLPKTGVLATFAVRAIPPRTRAAVIGRFGIVDPLRPPDHVRADYEKRARQS